MSRLIHKKWCPSWLQENVSTSVIMTKEMWTFAFFQRNFWCKYIFPSSFCLSHDANMPFVNLFIFLTMRMPDAWKNDATKFLPNDTIWEAYMQKFWFGTYQFWWMIPFPFPRNWIHNGREYSDQSNLKYVIFPVILG